MTTLRIMAPSEWSWQYCSSPHRYRSQCERPGIHWRVQGERSSRSYCDRHLPPKYRAEAEALRVQWDADRKLGRALVGWARLTAWVNERFAHCSEEEWRRIHAHWSYLTADKGEGWKPGPDYPFPQGRLLLGALRARGYKPYKDSRRLPRWLNWLQREAKRTAIGHFLYELETTIDFQIGQVVQERSENEPWVVFITRGDLRDLGKRAAERMREVLAGYRMPEPSDLDPIDDLAEGDFEKGPGRDR